MFFTIFRVYIKRLTEDCCPCEDSVKLIQFICWENASWSRLALAELLWQMAYAYCHDLKRHADTLTALLLLDDSWQQHRIHNALKVRHYQMCSDEIHLNWLSIIKSDFQCLFSVSILKKYYLLVYKSRFKDVFNIYIIVMQYTWIKCL